MGLKNGVESATTGEGKAAAEALYQKEAALLQKRNKAYNDFCEENGLKRKSERITIAKWDRARAAKARAAARRTDDQKRQPPRIRQEYYSDENTIFNNTSGQIIIENGYNIHSHANEINAANIVMKKFGGEIHLIPESTKEGEKRPDLLWNGKMWEEKTHRLPSQLTRHFALR